MSQTLDFDRAAQLLRELCIEHRISPVPRLEWSARMVRSLGRAYPSSNLIRLSTWLSAQQVDDTVRHELAHIAMGSRNRKTPHGLDWRTWAQKIGAVPKATSLSPPKFAPKATRKIFYWGLTCSNCGVRAMRARNLQNLYHVPCGPKRGKMAKVFRQGREEVAKWMTAKPQPD